MTYFRKISFTRSLKNRLSIFDHAASIEFYFASLFSQGLLISDGVLAPKIGATQSAYSGKISIRENREHPDFLYEILVKLTPYTENPFLRFFYLYQAIEYLMSGAFARKYAEAKAELDQETNISVTGLRDILEKLADATKEKTRINSALVPACPSTQLQAEKDPGPYGSGPNEFLFCRVNL